jgi:hypothetical protein
MLTWRADDVYTCLRRDRTVIALCDQVNEAITIAGVDVELGMALGYLQDSNLVARRVGPMYGSLWLPERSCRS